MLWISDKCSPRRAHLILQLTLRIRLSNTSDFSRFSKYHVELNAVICPTGWVKTSIVPICVVLESPDGSVSATSVCGFEVRRTEESLHIEVIPLLVCQYRSLGVGCNLVEPSLVCIVSNQVRLREERSWLAGQTRRDIFVMWKGQLTMRANFPCCERSV